jgi:hypothetical protein
MAIDFNPTILGKPLFPSSQRTGDFLRGVGQSVAQAFTPAAGTPPATMAGVTIPPAGASFSQLQYKGPLLGTGPMFGIRGAQQPAPQPAQPSFDYGTYAATRGFPSFDVTKIQTPFSQYSASAPQQLTASLAQSLPPLPTQLPTRVSAPEAITPNQATPAAGFARISDWSQSPLVQAARATGDVSALARATEQARNQGRSALAPKDITGVSLADLKELRPEAGFGTSRTPEQQQALLAQMRTQGAKMAGAQERFFTQKREELNALKGAAASASARGVSSIDIMKARALSQPTTLAGIRRQAYEYTQKLPMGGLGESAVAGFQKNLPVGGSAPRTATSLGTSGFALYEQEQAARRARGITGPYSNTRAENRRATREMARSLGMEPALSRREQQKQEDYFRRRNLM